MHLENLGIPYTEFGDQKEIDLLWNISQSLVSKAYLEEILQLIVTMTATVMQSKTCSLMLFNEEKQELAIAATQALSADYISKPNVKVGESVSGRAVKERRPLQILNLLNEPIYGFPEIAKKEGFVSMLSVPMVIGDRVIGVINVYTTTEHLFSDTEIKICQAVANQAAIAIENTKLRREMSEAKKALQERVLIDRAKALMMEVDKLSEADAFKSIQKTSRDRRVPMVEVANAILLAYSMKKKD